MPETEVTVPTVTLRAGSGTVSIPQLGFGVWQVEDDQATEAVAEALRVGYRSIDTAMIYGNEAGVGRALAASEVPTDDLFITTKLWNSDQGHSSALEALDASLERLGLDSVDMYLIHWPVPSRDTYVEAWKAVLEAREAGKIRVAGVCNFEIEHLERLQKETGELPALNQIELHPWLQQKPLREFHAAHGIVTEAWSPLGQGGDVLAEPVIVQIAERLGVSPAQVILRWHLQLENVVIPKSVTPERIASNFDVFGFELTGEDMQAIAGLDKGKRLGPDPMEFAVA
ncbi:aldo/keto reductase [Dermacoccaceae bacterium W4C1]